MMKRETLKDWRRPTVKMDYHPSAERERQLIDSHLEALDLIGELNRQLELAREEIRHASRQWRGPVA